ncbi:ImmA/IrrE family metallo-endopeptidase [Nocardia sp. NPDC055053]
MSISAAQNVAALLVERFDLVPPVPVEELLAHYADVQACDWPIDTVDAVMVRGPVGKPQVFYRPNGHRLRLRFTLAHELGHLNLAWHLGFQTCDTHQPNTNPAHDAAAGQIEQEADHFASCLLVPDRWLSGVLNQHGHDMARILESIAKAEVSAMASLLALRRGLPAGWIFRINNQPHIPTRSTLMSSNLDAAARDSGMVELHGQTVRWWRMCRPYTIPAEDTDPRKARDLLRSAIYATEPDPDRHARIEMSVNGTVGGGTKDVVGKPPGHVYASLIYRFQTSSNAMLLDQPDFELWLRRKAYATSRK